MAHTKSEGQTSGKRRPRLARGVVAAVLATLGIFLVVLGNAVVLENGTLDRSSPSSTSRTQLTTYLTEPVTEMEAAPPQADPAAGVPTRLVVPRLAIDSPVLRVQVENGVLEPPSNPREVGWDLNTARAGAAYGGTVITGHTVHTGGGALDELDDLRVDDAVRVATVRGTISYRVTDVTKLSKQAMTKHIPQLFSAEVPGRLVLITCTDWDGSEYLGNTVVLATPVGD